MASAIQLSVHGKLNPIGFENLLSRLPPDFPADGAGRVELDLGGVTLFDPYGLAALCAFVQYCANTHELHVRPPQTQGTAAYLAASGFPEMITKAGWGTLDAPIAQNQFRASSQNTRVMPLLAIRSDSDIFDVRERLRSILKHRGCPIDFANDLSAALSELCQNTIEHADDPTISVAAAQVYQNTQGVPFVIISVADGGIGLRHSLLTKHGVAVSNHIEAINMAFKGVPGRSTSGGMGLRKVLDTSARYHGRIDVRSGTAWATRRATGYAWEPRQGFCMPGTQVGVTVYFPSVNAK
jgi:hypothetical protein